MNKKYTLIVCFLMFALSVKAQFFKKNRLYPSQWVFSMYAYNIDGVGVDKDFLKKELATMNIPNNRWVAATPYGIHAKYHRNRLYASAFMGFLSSENDLNDSLRLRLRAQTLEMSIGVNLIAKGKCLISPYIGLRFNRMRNAVVEKSKSVSIDQYFKNRDIDLRINQLSVPIGINTTFYKIGKYHFGFYAAYLQKLHKNAWIYSEGTKLSHNLGSPYRNWNIGLGFGFGGSFNE